MMKKQNARVSKRRMKHGCGIGAHEKDLNALIEVLGKLSKKGEERAKLYVRDGRKNPARREEWAAGVCKQLEDAVMRLLLRRNRNRMGDFALELLRNVNGLKREYAEEARGNRLSPIRHMMDLDGAPYVEELIMAGARYACQYETVADVYGQGGD